VRGNWHRVISLSSQLCGLCVDRYSCFDPGRSVLWFCRFIFVNADDLWNMFARCRKALDFALRGIMNIEPDVFTYADNLTVC